jgi:phosphoglycerate dehydrogenase-like enzyme
MKALFLGRPELTKAVYQPAVLQFLGTLTEPLAFDREWAELAEDSSVDLSEVEVIFATWGMPKMTPAFLDRLPSLRAVFYAAGSVKGFATEEAYARNIQICSAWGANAIPVAEFTTSTVLLSLKQFWACASATRQRRTYHRPVDIPGAFRTTVGLVSLGMIGRLVVKRLRNFELKTLAYDPFITPAEAEDLQIELTGLEALFTRSDVVSIHTPWLKETEGLITSDLLSSLKPGATFINTSRGAVVDEHGLLQVARQRPDLTFLLDVTHPEPPPSDSPIYDLPNIILTPHIAGSAGGEVARMGEWMAEEFDRYRQGLPLRHEVTRGMLATMA